MTFKANEAPKLALRKISEAEVKERFKRGLIFSPAMSDLGKTFLTELKSQLENLHLKNDATQAQIDLQVVNTINLLARFHNDIKNATDECVLGRTIRRTEHMPMSYRIAISEAYDEIKLKHAVELNFRAAKK